MKQKPFEITGANLDLVPLAQDHLPLTMAWRNADDVRIWFKTSSVVAPEDHARWFTAYASRDDDFMFLIRDRRSSNFVGQLAMYRVDLNRHEGELGRLIAAPDFRGRGIMKQACGQLIHYFAGEFGLRKILLEVKAENERAIRLYQELQFKVVSREQGMLAMALEVGPG